MISSKDKAKELFDKMYDATDEMGNYPMCFDTSKHCALAAVNEIINTLDYHQWQNRNLIDYWNEVKQEIEKL